MCRVLFKVLHMTLAYVTLAVHDLHLNITQFVKLKLRHIYKLQDETQTVFTSKTHTEYKVGLLYGIFLLKYIEIRFDKLRN